VERDERGHDLMSKPDPRQPFSSSVTCLLFRNGSNVFIDFLSSLNFLKQIQDACIEVPGAVSRVDTE
jgi:hypothetical protein